MAATGLLDVKVGDPLVLATGSKYRGDEPVTVARIGRKYLYVNLHGHEYSQRFHRDTGAEDSQHGAREHLYTPEQYDEMKQRAALFEELRQAGIEVEWKAQGALTTDQLRALLAVIKPAA
ncbi:hypothetical protein [Streptomyces sp. NPDC017086]|uniref:beta barrel domain-containing protein n=1 Tax=Streptomyces sp. NPDC017086 TaxID=3364976 RepID=UPI003795FBDE